MQPSSRSPSDGRPLLTYLSALARARRAGRRLRCVPCADLDCGIRHSPRGRRRLSAVLRVLVGAVLLPFAALGAGPRKPVLRQIDLPHSYYYREMYLPQLTSGPAAAAWSPDGQWLVHAMQGVLWRQRVEGPVAGRLTDTVRPDQQPARPPAWRGAVF